MVQYFVTFVALQSCDVNNSNFKCKNTCSVFVLASIVFIDRLARHDYEI